MRWEGLCAVGRTKQTVSLWALLLLMAFAFEGCAVGARPGHQQSPNYEAVLELRPISGANVTPEMLAKARELLSRRLRRAQVPHNISESPPSQLIVRVRFPEGLSEAEAPRAFAPHTLTFHVVHPDSDRLLRQGASSTVPNEFMLARFAGTVGDQGLLIVEREPVIQGGVEDAYVSILAGKPIITSLFAPEAAQRLRKLLQERSGYRLAIMLDGRVFAAPTIREPPNPQNAVAISGEFDVSEAEGLATVLRSGGLPVPVQFVRGRLLSR